MEEIFNTDVVIYGYDTGHFVSAFLNRLQRNLSAHSPRSPQSLLTFSIWHLQTALQTIYFFTMYLTCFGAPWSSPQPALWSTVIVFASTPFRVKIGTTSAYRRFPQMASPAVLYRLKSWNTDTLTPRNRTLLIVASASGGCYHARRLKADSGCAAVYAQRLPSGSLIVVKYTF